MTKEKNNQKVIVLMIAISNLVKFIIIHLITVFFFVEPSY